MPTTRTYLVLAATQSSDEQHQPAGAIHKTFLTAASEQDLYWQATQLNLKVVRHYPPWYSAWQQRQRIPLQAIAHLCHYLALLLKSRLFLLFVYLYLLLISTPYHIGVVFFCSAQDTELPKQGA